MINLIALLFILIGIFGSDNRVKASFYLFLYTFLENIQCKRTKSRGSPKALVTKVIEETLLLAWLMTQGKVISLKISIMKWVIADLNQAKPVKEQRVDGSSKSRNLDFVRCTLVAGKPVLGRKISFHPDNGKVVSGLFSPKAFIHSTRSTKENPTLSGQVNNIYYPLEDEKSQVKKLNPWFVTGFVDGEGCFAIGLFVSSDYKMGYRTQAIFKITLKNQDFNLLCQIKDYFGVGSITKHGSTTLEYRVTSLKDLSVILSHFEKYPLIFNGSYSVSNLEAYRKKIRGDKKVNKGKMYSTIAFPPKKNQTINPWFITGFIDAEASFIISISKNSKTTTGYGTRASLQIGLHCKDLPLLESIKSFFGVGDIYKQGNNAYMFRVCKIKDLQVIIHHLEEYSLITKKQADYLRLFFFFIKKKKKKEMIVELMNKKEHTTKEGLNKIIDIKASMNKGLDNATNELKVAFPNINAIVRPSVLDFKIKDSYWLAGFTEGESNFGIRIKSSKSISTGKSVSLIFKITQHKRDILLMKNIEELLGCGQVNQRLEESCVDFIVTKLSDINEKIMAGPLCSFFFKQYPLIGSKKPGLHRFL